MTNIGRTIYGFCNGFLGDELSTDWGPKIIEAEGVDWIVVRGENGVPALAVFADGWLVPPQDQKQHLIDEWATDPEEEHTP